MQTIWSHKLFKKKKCRSDSGLSEAAEKVAVQSLFDEIYL